MKTNVLLRNLVAVCFLLQACNKQELQLAEAETYARAVTQTANALDDLMEGVLPTGTYKFVTHNTFSDGTYKAMRPAGGVAAPENGLVEQRAFTTNNNGHEWRAISLGNGNYHIFVQGSPGYRVLTVLGTATPASGTSLGVKTIVQGNQRQIWKIEYIGLGTYKIKLASNTSLAVNITPAGSTANGAVFKLGGTGNLNSSFLIYRMAYKDLEVTNFFKRTSGWMHGDGANTIPLTNNKVMWLMDDGGIDGWNGSTVPCGFQANNSVLLQPKDNWAPSATSTLLQPAASGVKRFYFRTEPATNNYNWITTGFQYGDVVRVYCSTLAPPATDVKRAYWGKYSVASNSVTGYTRLPANVENGTIKWGRGFVVGDDNYVYAYGHKDIFITQSLHVARIPKNNLDGPWSFYTPSGWVGNEAQAASIGTTQPGPFVSKVGNKYVAVSTELSVGCDNGTRIYTSWSDSPTGPFSDYKEVYRIDDNLEGHTPFFYWAKAHPEYIKNDGGTSELLITYDLNGYGKMFPSTEPPCVETCVGGRMNPDHFRPRGIRIPLKLIDPSFPQ